MLLTSLDPDNEAGKMKGRLSSGGEKLFKIFREIHESFPSKDATPRGYLNFLQTYIHLFNQKKESIENKQKHLQVYNFAYLSVFYQHISLPEGFFVFYFFVILVFTSDIGHQSDTEMFSLPQLAECLLSVRHPPIPSSTSSTKFN